MVDRYSLVSISVNNFKLFEDVDVIFTSEKGNARRAMTIFWPTWFWKKYSY